MLHVKLARYYGHFEGDATTYRAPGEVDRIRAEQDCLQRFRKQVTEAALLTAGDLDAVDQAAAEEVELSVRHAKVAPIPNEADLLSDVYVAY
jgi:TPP-dependent pyruvate/acetoin dehydrogenase alpha subunit